MPIPDMYMYLYAPWMLIQHKHEIGGLWDQVLQLDCNGSATELGAFHDRMGCMQTAVWPVWLIGLGCGAGRITSVEN